MLNVDVTATDEERAEFNEDLRIALQSGTLLPEEKMEIGGIENLKLARQMLILRVKKNRAAASQSANIQFQQQMMADDAKRKGEMEMLQFKTAVETQAKLAEIDGKAKIEAFLAEAKMRQISHEKEWEAYIEKIKSQGRWALETYKEDRKDDRTDLQATQQSMIVDQRHKQTPPVDFTQRKQQEMEVSMPEIPQLGQMEQITQ